MTKKFPFFKMWHGYLPHKNIVSFQDVAGYMPHKNIVSFQKHFLTHQMLIRFSTCFVSLPTIEGTS